MSLCILKFLIFSPSDPLLDSHFSFCSKSCTSITVTTTKRISETSRDKKYFNGYKVVALNFNPTVQVTRSVEKVPLVSLFNDFGSSMGLWLGISVFSIFEMVEGFANRMKIGDKWKVVSKLMIIAASLFALGVVSLFLYFTIE